MKYHKIPKIEKSVCTAEQKIAYNYASTYGITNLDNAENQRQNALQELIAKRRLAREV